MGSDLFWRHERDQYNIRQGVLILWLINVYALVLSFNLCYNTPKMEGYNIWTQQTTVSNQEIFKTCLRANRMDEFSLIAELGEAYIKQIISLKIC